MGPYFQEKQRREIACEAGETRAEEKIRRHRLSPQRPQTGEKKKIAFKREQVSKLSAGKVPNLLNETEDRASSKILTQRRQAAKDFDSG